MDSNDLHIDDLLRFLVEREGSDLHLKPMRAPLIRLNGKLVPLKMDPLQPEVIPLLLQTIIPEHLRPKFSTELSVDFGYSLPGVSRFRASVFHQRGTQSAVFRRVPFDFPSLEEWGLPPVLGELAGLVQGLVLITGPTGSGKSSTLAAMMRLITDTRLVHIVTIEDPIEFLLADGLGAVTQREVGTDTPRFETALRNVLRQDPDVIMVGEMRDAETVQTVLTAAETGHLVFSTLHTNGAVQTIDRIIDLFPDRNQRQIRQQLANVLQAVVSLRLVERADGSGLIAATEILRSTPRVAKLILQGQLDALEEEMENSVRYHYMQSLNQSLAALVLNRAVRLETALAASGNPGDLDLILRKSLHAEAQIQLEDEAMAEPLGDFSKILELQEIKQLYDEQQERHAGELAERAAEIERLRVQLARQTDVEETGGRELEELRRENERLNQQIQLVRSEYDATIERLNSRIRDLSGSGPRGTSAGEERRGFFRR